MAKAFRHLVVVTLSPQNNKKLTAAIHGPSTSSTYSSMYRNVGGLWY